MNGENGQRSKRRRSTPRQHRDAGRGRGRDANRNAGESRRANTDNRRSRRSRRGERRQKTRNPRREQSRHLAKERPQNRGGTALSTPPERPPAAPASKSEGPLIAGGAPTPRLERTVFRWGKIVLVIAAVITAVGGAGYLLALAVGVLAAAIVALAEGLQLLAWALVWFAIGIFLVSNLGAKE